MHKFLATLLVFTFLLFPGTSMAIISLVGGGFCADLVTCGILGAIQGFLAIFGGKLACLFGSAKDMFAAGLTTKTVVQDSAYDNLPNIKSLTDTVGPFGGQILTKIKCKCGGKLGAKEVFMVGPPKRTVVAVTSATKVYDYRSLNVGNWVLGISTGQVVCKIPKALAISQIGTSR
ncbi:MAG: hypothetical protein AAB522_00215 [Patescibacteria group bacterium]